MDNVISKLKSVKAEEFALEENLDPVLGISYSLDGKLIGITRYLFRLLPERNSNSRNSCQRASVLGLYSALVRA